MLLNAIIFTIAYAYDILLETYKLAARMLAPSHHSLPSGMHEKDRPMTVVLVHAIAYYLL